MTPRRILFKEIGSKVVRKGEVRAELIETRRLLLFKLRGRFPPDTLEAFSIHISNHYPKRHVAIVLLAPDQDIEAFEEIGFDG